MVKEGKTVAEEQKAKYEIIYDMGTELYIAKVQLASEEIYFYGIPCH